MEVAAGCSKQPVAAPIGHKIFPVGQTTRYDPCGKTETYKDKGAIRERRTGAFIDVDIFEFKLRRACLGHANARGITPIGPPPIFAF